MKQVLEKHAPGKQKYIRTKNSKYITKALPKESRSGLRNTFLEDKRNESRIAYNKQRNICVNFLLKTKDYSASPNTKIMKDNRKFGKTINPSFPGKPYSKESISFINKDRFDHKKWRGSKDI